jgi:glycosyltransferase involved in cell wall biosynthesis
MSRLSKKYKVLFVENQRSIFAFFKDPAVLKRQIRPLRKKGENLLVYYPAPGLPFAHKFYWPNCVNNFILKYFLRQVIKKYRFLNSILWIYSPKGAFLINKLDERFICFDCVDEYSAYPGVNRKVYGRLEKKILEKANIVFTTSRILFLEKQKKNPNTFYTPNPADFSLFLKANEEKVDHPLDIKDIPKPIIGFFGELNYKIDLQLIEYTASSNPNWSIVLVGPIVGINLSNLKKLNNIYFLGYKQKKHLPDYLRVFSVCIIPYVLTDYTKRISPLKIYEYFASGKQVVSTDIPECREFGRLIRISKDKNEFVSHIDQALKEDDKNIAEERIELAKQNTWENKIEKMLTFINERFS